MQNRALSSSSNGAETEPGNLPGASRDGSWDHPPAKWTRHSRLGEETENKNKNKNRNELGALSQAFPFSFVFLFLFSV